MNFRKIKYRLQFKGNANPSKWIKLGFIIISFGCLLGSCENDIAKIKEFSNTEDMPEITAEGYEVLYYDSTVIRSKLQTPEMTIHSKEKEPYTEFSKGVLLSQFDSNMNITSNITAQYAKYFQTEERWEAKNKVVAINQKGDTLKTEYLVWDQKKAKIYSDQFVKIIQKDGQVTTGTSFESNQDFSEYVIKNLTGKMYVDVHNK